MLAKLTINVFATTVLLLYLPTFGYLAGVAAETTSSGQDLDALRSASPLLHAGAALLLLLLLVATLLSVYKPRG